MKLLTVFGLILFGSIAFSTVPPTAQEAAYLYYKNKTINGGFENGTTNWTLSAGSFTVTTTAADVGEGARAGVFNASAASQTLSGTNYTIERGLRGANAYAKCTFRTTATDYKIQVFDGTNVISEQTIAPTNEYLEQGINFVFPSSGTARLRAISGSDAADLFIDDCYIGRASNVGTVAQAQFVGSAYFAQTASCSWTRTNTAVGAFGTDTDCPGPTIDKQVIGSWQTTDADLPRVTINSLPAGLYKVTVTGSMYGAGKWTMAVSDGTSTRGYASGGGNGGGTFQPANVSTAWFEYTSQGNRSFEVYGSSSSGSIALDNLNSNDRTTFMIERYPLSAEGAYRVDTIASSWSGYHDSTCQWNSSSGTYVTPSADASCGFTERTNVNFGTVSSTGSKTPGITFTPIRVGRYRICATTQLLNDTTFSYGRMRLNDGTNTYGEASVRSANGATGVPATICALLPVTSLAAVNLNLQINASSGQTSMGAYDTGTQAIDWTINAIDQQIPAPIVVGSVSTNSTGAERIERAYVAATCTGSPCTIASQSGSWLSSITRASTGSYSLNFASGMFSAVPSCAILPANPSEIRLSGTPTTSAFTFQTFDSSGSFADGGFSVLCMGPR